MSSDAQKETATGTSGPKTDNGGLGSTPIQSTQDSTPSPSALHPIVRPSPSPEPPKPPKSSVEPEKVPLPPPDWLINRFLSYRIELQNLKIRFEERIKTIDQLLAHSQKNPTKTMENYLEATRISCEMFEQISNNEAFSIGIQRLTWARNQHEAEFIKLMQDVSGELKNFIQKERDFLIEQNVPMGYQLPRSPTSKRDVVNYNPTS